ncbi:MAG: Hint domain-containing protein [Deltaproteobacteria bacterium]|nr:Hint domain-containing protein [Deltaproteobacteria bacterium]
MCFVAATLIETANGPRAIESIKVGDRVFAKSDSTGEIGLLSVEAVHVHAHQPTIVVTVCSRDIALLKASHPCPREHLPEADPLGSRGAHRSKAGCAGFSAVGRSCAHTISRARC